MSARIRTLLGMGLLAAAVGVAPAQVSQKTTETKGAPMKTTKSRVVEGDVISVNGNVVDFQTAAGGREVTVPAGFMFQMDGKDIGVADLKPGMKVKATVTETTTVTPVTIHRREAGRGSRHHRGQLDRPRAEGHQEVVVQGYPGTQHQDLSRGQGSPDRRFPQRRQDHRRHRFAEAARDGVGALREGLRHRSSRACPPLPRLPRLPPRLPRLRRPSRLPLRLPPTKSFPRPRARFRWSVCSACCRSLPASP